MKKNIRRIIMIIVLTCFLMTVSYAEEVSIGNLKGNQQALNGTGLIKTGKYIVSIITSIGVVVSVIVIAAIGIKYMLGSAADKAEYKRTLMPYLIGAVLVFGASTIAQIIYLFVK